MTIKTYWQLDVAEDATRAEPSARATGLFRDVRPAMINRYDYYAQVGQAAAQTAFDGLYLPHRAESDDAVIVAAAIARETPRLTLIPEFPASAGSAVYAAKQAVSFQRQTHDRLGWAVAPDREADTRAGDGDHLPEEQLIARVEEFLIVARGVHGTTPFSFDGDHFAVENGGFEAPLNRAAFPPVFLRGDSEEALALSARRADVHLFAAAPLDTLRNRIEALEALSVGEGRHVEYGILQPVLSRDEADEAQRDAARSHVGPHVLVGDHETVATRLADLASFGIRHVVLGGSPSLEEAYRVGQHVLPRFRALTGRAALAA